MLNNFSSSFNLITDRCRHSYINRLLTNIAIFGRRKINYTVVNRTFLFLYAYFIASNQLKNHLVYKNRLISLVSLSTADFNEKLDQVTSCIFLNAFLSLCLSIKRFFFLTIVSRNTLSLSYRGE